MKNYILVTIILLISSLTFAQYEEADAVFKKIVHEYTLNDDGSIDYRNYKELKLQTHRAFNRLHGETFIEYNPDYQSLKINESYTIMQNGIKVMAPKNAFNTVLPSAAAKSAAHNHLIEMVVTHTGLEVGASIFLDYTLHTNREAVPYLMGYEILPQQSPAESIEVIIRVPAAVSLQHQTNNIRTSPEISSQNNITSYLWKFKNMQSLPHENHMLAQMSSLPSILFSTARDMYTATNWFTKNEAFAFQLNPQIIDEFNLLCEDKENELEQIRALQEMVVNDINLNRIHPEIMAFKFRSPIEVWQSNTGTEIEKAVLLTALLHHGGIQAKVVGLLPKRLYKSSLGVLNTMQRFLVQVNPKEGAQLYLCVDHLNKSNEKYHLSEYTIIELNRDAESLSAITMKSEMSKINMIAALSINNENEISGKVDIDVSAAFNPYFDLLVNTKKAKALVSGLQIDSVTNLKTNEYRSEASLLVKDKKALNTQEDYVFWTLAEATNGLSDMGLSHLLNHRISSLKTLSPIDESYEFTIEVPDTYELVNNMVEINEKNSVASIKIQIYQRNNKIVIQRAIKMHKDLILIDDYQDLRSAMLIWNDSNYKRLVFKNVE